MRVIKPIEIICECVAASDQIYVAIVSGGDAQHPHHREIGIRCGNGAVGGIDLGNRGGVGIVMIYAQEFVAGVVVSHVDIQWRAFGEVGKLGHRAGSEIHTVPRLCRSRRPGSICGRIIRSGCHGAGRHILTLRHKSRRRGIRYGKCV